MVSNWDFLSLGPRSALVSKTHVAGSSETLCLYRFRCRPVERVVVGVETSGVVELIVGGVDMLEVRGHDGGLVLPVAEANSDLVSFGVEDDARRGAILGSSF